MSDLEILMSGYGLEENQNGAELEHHQVKGARWYVHRGPPYPLDREDKAKNPASMKKGSTSYADARKRAKKRKAAKKKAQKLMEKAAKKEVKEAKAAEKAENKERDRIAKTARDKAKYAKTPESLYKHKELYSVDEIKDILNRFEWEEKVKNFREQDRDRGQKFVERTTKNANNILKLATTAAAGYNLYAAVSNAFGGGAKTISGVNIGAGGQAKNDNQKQGQNK